LPYVLHPFHVDELEPLPPLAVACSLAPGERQSVNFAYEWAGDTDGVPNIVEEDGPNEGDGDCNDEPDRSQNDVASLPSAIGEQYVTFVASNGNFSQIAAVDPSTAACRLDCSDVDSFHLHHRVEHALGNSGIGIG
jgi:hypothetical protein